MTPRPEKVVEVAEKRAKRKPRPALRRSSKGGGSGSGGGGGSAVRTVPKVPLVKA